MYLDSPDHLHLALEDPKRSQGHYWFVPHAVEIFGLVVFVSIEEFQVASWHENYGTNFQ